MLARSTPMAQDKANMMQAIAKLNDGRDSLVTEIRLSTELEQKYTAQAVVHYKNNTLAKL